MFALPRLTTVVKNLLIINGLLFLACQTIGDRMYDLFASHWFQNPLFKPWQIVTHFFMHSDFEHILRNMVMLFFIGTFLESIWGAKRFLQYYLLCGIVGYLIYSVIQLITLNYYGQFLSPEVIALAAESKYLPADPNSFEYTKTFLSSSVGASGAIFGIITALWVIIPNRELMLLFIPIPIKVKYLAMFLLAMEIYSQIIKAPGDSVSHLGHLSGMLAGYLIIKYWNKRGFTNFQQFN
ncbi:MAG: rhomboid family intramembrane serine protease [Flavobacteriales bacterium]